MIDKKALALLKKYYLPYGSEELLSQAERVNAVKNGVLMPETVTSHDEIVAEVKALSERISLESVAKAFLYSLSTGDLRYRSALSSLVWAKALPEHEMVLKEKEYEWSVSSCKACGCTHGLEKTESVDWNEYDAFHYFSPIEYGRKPDFTCAEYVLNDLRAFEQAPAVEPTDEDYRILNGIFACAKEMKSHNMDTALATEIRKRKFIRATGNGIYCVLATLSICGIFESAEHKGFLHSFANSGDFKGRRDGLIQFPLFYWRGKNGVNYEAVNEVFGSFSGDKLSSDRAKIQSYEAPSTPKKKSPSKAESYFTPGVYLIMLTDEERRYLALDPINPDWEKEIMFSDTCGIKRRTVLFYEGNTIVKTIHEEHRFRDDGYCRWKQYQEFDTRLKTDNRKTILPLTTKGRAKPVLPSNVLAIRPFGSELIVRIQQGGTYILAGNLRNYQDIALGEDERISKIMTDADFHEFMKYYIATCPDDYFDRIAEVRNMDHQTVKFRAGDVFVCQEDRTHYSYGLILGKVRELEKWPELPKEHSLRHLMMQPLIIRMYDFLTTDNNLTLEQIADKPLRTPAYCSDADIIWGRHKIVAHKELVPDDVMFYLRFTAVNLSGGLSTKKEAEGLLCVEWGFSSVKIPFENVPDDVREAFNKVRTIGYGGVYTSISGDLGEPSLPENSAEVNIIMNYLGLPEDCTLDDFAAKYGGLSRQEYIDLVEKRCK